METKLTVIIPIYNSAEYLDQCLESVHNQTLKDIQVICIDNHSSDNSVEIIKKWADIDDRFEVVLNDYNITQAGSMNKALWLAKGEYIAECDSDDWVEPQAYETLYNAAKYVDAEVVRCNVYKHMHGNVERYSNGYGNIYNICFNPMEQDDMTKLCVIGRWCCIPAGIYKTDFIKDNRLFYRKGAQFEDNSLSFKIRTTATKYMYIDDYLYHYRMDNANSGTAGITNVDGIFEQFEEIKRFSEGKGIDELVNSWKFCIYLWALGRLKSTEDKIIFLDKMARDMRDDVVARCYFNSDEEFQLHETLRNGAIPPSLTI